MTRWLVWQGTEEDAAALLTAVDRNCTCQPGQPGPCPAHSMMLDKHILDHLLFARRIADRLWREETVIVALAE